MSAIELVALTRRFGSTATAVDGIDLRIPAGSYCCMLGPSGCGKTTTLRLIAGHEQATDGDIIIGGQNITDLAPAQLGIVFVTHSQEEAMALADLVVVMQAGQIRQSGTPRDVFERPADGFVARFIGGHNVLTEDGHTFAVRGDRCRILPSGSARIAAVEYQGAIVRIALTMPDGAEAIALIPDDEFDPAALSWTQADAHPLTPETAS